MYLGPFIVCKYDKVEVEDKIRACTNEKCRAYKTETKDAFCLHCSVSTNYIISNVLRNSVDLDFLMVKLRKYLSLLSGGQSSQYMQDKMIHVWVPKLDLNFNRPTDFDMNKMHIYNLIASGSESDNMEFVEDEVESFVNQYQKVLRYLYKIYKKKTNVRVHWGILNT